MERSSVNPVSTDITIRVTIAIQPIGSVSTLHEVQQKRQITFRIQRVEQGDVVKKRTKVITFGPISNKQYK